MNIIETNLSFTGLSKRGKTTRIILHHAAMHGSVEDIHRVHRNQGYSGIGYHFYVRQDGSVYRGRPIDTVGAHASGSNSDSVGVCFEGNFENETMSNAQQQAGKELVLYLKNLYNISKVQAHREVNSTACPGRNFPFDSIANFTGQGTWKQDEKGWWYQYSDGSYPKSQWLQLDSWYYFDANGYAICDDWLSLNDQWYYLDEQCRMVVGWKEIDSKWYYFNDSGVMATGLQTIKDELFYFHDDGHMCRTNERGALV